VRPEPELFNVETEEDEGGRNEDPEKNEVRTDLQEDEGFYNVVSGIFWK